jgi:hypothetical protein
MRTYRLDWFPGIYGAMIDPTVPIFNSFGFVSRYVPDKDADNGLFFSIYPIKNFILDQQFGSPTYGNPTYVGLNASPNSSIAINVGPTPSPSPSPNKDYNYAIRVLDFDTQPKTITLTTPTPAPLTVAPPNAFFRTNGTDKIQIYSWAPTTAGATNTINIPFQAVDSSNPVEDDPYDVMAYRIYLPTPSPTPNGFTGPTATPLPTVTNTPALAGVGGRLNCTSVPNNYPVKSTLRLDQLVNYKQCQMNWTQASTDAGTDATYEIWVQDNIGAAPSATPAVFGHGAKHPLQTTTAKIDFNWLPTETVGGNTFTGITPTPTPVGYTGALAAPPVVTVQYTTDSPNASAGLYYNVTSNTYGNGNNPGAPLLDASGNIQTIVTCPNQIPAITVPCVRSRIWITLAGCSTLARYCALNNASLYKTYYFRTIQNVIKNPGNTQVANYTSPEYPLEASPITTSDSSSLTNGPETRLYVQLVSLETNQAPYFTTSFNGTTSLGNAYQVSGTGWNTVLSATSGVAPTPCASAQAPFSCDLSIKKGDTLLSSSATVMQEQPAGGTKYAFTLFAKDDAVRPELKTLSAVSPTKALILDGANKGKSYTIPSFASAAVNFLGATPTPAPGGTPFPPGSLQVTFQWAPTDEEAYFLSNPAGFLIPIVISDLGYKPSNEVGFPVAFTVPPKSSTIWVWGKIAVVNNTPIVEYNNGGSWTPLDGAILQFNTQNISAVPTPTPQSIQIRIKEDKDIARYRYGTTLERALTYFPLPNPSSSTAYSNSGYFQSSAPTTLSVWAGVPTSPSPYPSMTSTGVFITQTFNLFAKPDASQMGTYTNNVVTVTDPGDPSLGYSLPGNAAGRVTLPNIPATFTINVVGKPIFSVPAPSDSTIINTGGFRVGNNFATATGPSEIYQYPLYPLYYPLSIYVSNPKEHSSVNSTKNFFMGIQIKATPTPTSGTTPITISSITQTPGGTGIYVNENYILKSNANTFSAYPGTATQRVRMINLAAVLDSGNCTGNRWASNASDYATIVRFNDSQGKLEYCHLTQSSFTNSVATTVLSHNIAQSVPTPLTLSSVKIDRVTTLQTPVTSSKLDQEFQDFKVRCESGGVNSLITSGICRGLTGNSSGLNLASGTIVGINAGTFSYNDSINRSAVFTFDGTSQVKKSFMDSSASASPTPDASNGNRLPMWRSLDASVLKGERVTFTANLSSAPAANSPTLQARWYVNGCLKRSFPITTSTITYDFVTPQTSAGANNDCSGQFDRGDNNSDDLSMIRVRLAISDNTETIPPTPTPAPRTGATPAPSPVPDGTKIGYAFNLRVINNSPSPQLTTANPRSSPIPFASTSVKFMMPIAAPANNLFAYTDGSTLRVREFGKMGDMKTSAGINFNMSCTITTSPAWIGISLPSGTTMTAAIASTAIPGAGLSDAYPLSSGIYDNSGNACYKSGMGFVTNGSSYSGTSLVGTKASVAQGLAYSPYRSSTRAIASWNSTNKSYLIDGVNSSSQFWNYDISLNNIYATIPTPLSSSYPNNMVTKSLVSGDKLFQLIGADPNKANSGHKGFVLISSLSDGSSFASASTIRSIELPTCSGVPNGYADVVPIDAAYYPNDNTAPSDTLFVIGVDSSSNSNSILMEIKNPSASPTCRVVTSSLIYTSRDITVHNTNLNKLVIDTVNGILWGGIVQGTLLPGQIFSYDFISKRDPAILNVSFAPHSILYSPAINAVHVFSNKYDSSTTPVTYPQLYRVW